MVNVGDIFQTSHLPKKHSAIIDGRSYGPYTTEIELVRQLPVDLEKCEVVKSEPNWDWTISESDRKFCTRHTWKRKT